MEERMTEWRILMEQGAPETERAFGPGVPEPAAAEIGTVLKGLVDQARRSVPPGTDCEVQIGGRITRTLEGEGKGGIKAWIIEVSLGGGGSVAEENNFSLTVKFNTGLAG